MRPHDLPDDKQPTSIGDAAWPLILRTPGADFEIGRATADVLALPAIEDGCIRLAVRGLQIEYYDDAIEAVEGGDA